ncbi:hypothetical protein Trihar35433_5854 [Trichoderma harzianum]|nr:hypothetical protein Trihar35433_5854 [Trichoderma harzianum]
MEWQSEWEEGGFQEPAALDLDVMHAGRQFEETDIEDDTTSSELAHTTPPICDRIEDSESCDQTDDEPVVEKSSSPEPSTDSSSQGGEASTPTKESELLKVDIDWTVPKPSDPWNHLMLWNRESPEYIQKLHRHLPSAQVPSKSSADASGIAVTQSVQTDSGYASNPSGASAAPKLQMGGVVGESHNIPSAAKSSEPIVVQKDEDAGESQTIYSDQSSEYASRTREYIWEFTNYLYQQLTCSQQIQLTSKNIEKATRLLPELLGGYATKMGQTSPIQMSRDIMYFVHKNRKLIAQSLKIIFEDDQMITTRGRDSEMMSTNDKIHLLWSKGSDNEDSLDPERDLTMVAEFDDNGNDDDDYPPGGDFSHYRDAILEDPSFNWLMQRFAIELNSSETEFAMEAIRRLILDILRDNGKRSRKRSPKPFKMTFDVNCDIPVFMRQQEYDEPAADVILKVLTLTGTIANVQALTSEQYLQQTWPTIGCYLLYTIQDALRGHDTAFPFRYSSTYTYADRTKIKVSIGKNTIRVEAIGTAYSIAEIGEQLGWLATTLWSAPNDSEFRFRHPEIAYCHVEAFQSSRDDEDEFQKAFRCRLEISQDEIMPNAPNNNGQCWHPLFNNPVIVKGYPISPRGSFLLGAGLELPFDVLITLAYTQYLTIFGNKTVAKGFSTALIPTMIHDDIIYWHFLFNESGSRIPYWDSRIQQGILVTPDQFRSARRHIVGWCANAQNKIGSPEANYDIDWSGLPQNSRGGLIFDEVRFSITAGYLLKVATTFKRGNGTTFKLGRKDRSPCGFVSDNYKSLIEHIDNHHHIVLYDVEEERAWLTDGLPGLLHLFRTSIRKDEKENHKNIHKQIKEAPPSTQGTMAAKMVLLDIENRLISLGVAKTDLTKKTTVTTINGESSKTSVDEKKEIQYTFEDRVEEIGLFLEKAIDQNALEITGGVLRGTSKCVLSGFDFLAVATRSKLNLRTKKIPDANYKRGWTDLVDHLEAITLFGNNFGDLIQPRVGSLPMPCTDHELKASLPSGGYLMAVCGDVLERIMEMNGSKRTIPRRLAGNLYWHNRGGWIQVISSENRSLGVTAANSINIGRDGAVVFGHRRRRFFQKFRNTGDDERISSLDEDTQSQTPSGVYISSEADSESSTTNQNQLHDIMCSGALDGAPLLRTGVSNLNNIVIDHQLPDVVISAPSYTSASSTTDGSALDIHQEEANRY